MNDVLIAPAVAFAGSGVAGFLAGYAVRKILKWIALLVGIFLVGLFALSARGWLTVQWDKINDSVSTLANSTSTAGANDVLHNIMNSLGMPATAGVGVGFAVGFIRG